MAIHSSIHAWGIPWTEEPGRLQSMGSHRVGLKQLSTHYIHDKLKAKAFMFKDLKCASNSWCCLRMLCEFRKFSKTVPGKRPTQVNKTSLQQHSATLTILENLK